MENFNPQTDKIAITIKEFTLKKKSEFPFDKYAEPYIVSIAVDENGINNPAIDFNMLPFPKVRKGGKIEFQGVGHLIYGPNNPGSFVAYSILFMESDDEIRRVGQLIDDIMKSDEVKVGVKSLMTSLPTYSTAVNVLTQVTSLIANVLKNNKDDELFRISGALLRDVVPSYDILRDYEDENDFIKVKTSIMPLEQSNNLGAQTRRFDI